MQTNSYAGFLENQYKRYAVYDNEINIPNFIDGLKISQRKVLYCALSSGHIKVQQLASETAKVTHYNHGEDNLNKVIVGLAQTFKGSNNYNFLYPDGSFGTSLIPVASSPRYIHTEITENFKNMFLKDDFKIIELVKYDKYEIEPKFFIPLIPTLFVNGSIGIGNGFSCNIFPRNVKDMIEYIKDYIINTESNKKIRVHYNNYNGLIEMDDELNQLTVYGKFTIDKRTLTITEIPFTTLEKTKALLDKLIDEKLIYDYMDYSTGDNYNIKCKLTPDTKTDEDYINKKFKLIFKDKENITVWLDNRVVSFDNVYEYIKSFVKIRFKFYEMRINKILEQLKHDLKDLEDQLKFLKCVVNDTDKFISYNKQQLIEFINSIEVDQKYINTPIYKITKENIDKLEKKDIKKIKDEIKYYETIDIKNLYIEELDNLNTIIS